MYDHVPIKLARVEFKIQTLTACDVVELLYDGNTEYRSLSSPLFPERRRLLADGTKRRTFGDQEAPTRLNDTHGETDIFFK